MTDEQKSEQQDKPEVEGMTMKVRVDPAKEVEGQSKRFFGRSDAESPEEKAEEKGDESRDADDEPEVEGQYARH